MTAIVGIACWDDRVGPDSSIDAMLDASEPFGSARQSARSLGRTRFGHALSIDLPQDNSDAQPFVGRGGTTMFAVDLRIDNRDEMTAALGLTATNGATMSDGALFGAAWDRWAEGTLDRMLGDASFAVWVAARCELVIGRTPATTRPLFYHIGTRFAAFASMPDALLRLDGVPKRLNLDELGRRLSGHAYFGTAESVFTTIDSVEPGTIVRLTSQGRRINRFWDPSQIAVKRRSVADAADQMRAEFDRSVTACLRRSTGGVATHLSGGRDSGAVTAGAAVVLDNSGETLTAYTAAPQLGFAPGDGRYLHDESALAATLAAGFPNIRHVISRSRPVALCALLDTASRLHCAPMGNPANAAYWLRLLAEARGGGASVLLTGANGNFSISLGGLGALVDVACENGTRGWWPIARAMDVPWRTILNQSFGHHLPKSVHRLVHRTLVGAPAHQEYPLFKPALRDRMRSAATVSDTRPPASYRSTIRQLYRPLDYADKLGLALHDIDLRDPTADRRLIDFCLSLPADQVVGAHGQRPIYDLAFADRVPAAVRTAPVKGFQGADWFKIYDPEEIRAGFHRYSANRLVRELIDVERAMPLLDAWPSVGGYRRASYDLYANHMMIALSLASFIDVHFPEQRDR